MQAAAKHKALPLAIKAIKDIRQLEVSSVGQTKSQNRLPAGPQSTGTSPVVKPASTGTIHEVLKQAWRHQDSQGIGSADRPWNLEGERPRPVLQGRLPRRHEGN